jgi:hypothetical protein
VSSSVDPNLANPMSDHRPLWAEFQVDFSDDHLKEARVPG